MNEREGRTVRELLPTEFAGLDSQIETEFSRHSLALGIPEFLWKVIGERAVC